MVSIPILSDLIAGDEKLKLARLLFQYFLDGDNFMTRRSFSFYSATLAMILCISGCSEHEHNKPTAQGTAEKNGGAEGGHPEEGPHKGHLIELGKEEYHVEVVHDDAAEKVIVYLLDGKAESPVAIADNEISVNLVVAGKPQQFKLPAVPQTQDKPGQSSRFELVDRHLCDALDDETTTGRFNLAIAGKPFSGEISHSGHDDHDSKKK
ncbi:MAG: hypothetical protein J0M17_05160 [Planctomycetes bacterium]|nr:hypothetical protein [Planctomycetota bacterium]